MLGDKHRFEFRCRACWTARVRRDPSDGIWRHLDGTPLECAECNGTRYVDYFADQRKIRPDNA